MSSLIETTLFGTVDYVDQAIKEIQKISHSVQYSGGKICVRFSGGKDSIVIKELRRLAGVPFEVRFSRTSVDPPELLQFISRYHSDVIVDKNLVTMFQLIIKKVGPRVPLLLQRVTMRSHSFTAVCSYGMAFREV